MPYIDQEARKRLRNHHSLNPKTDGEVVYLLTTICRNYMPANPCFEDYERIIGALECAKLEFYRRMVATYEDEKLGQNGDVF